MVFFGVGPFVDNYRKVDINLFQRLVDGEGSSRPPELTPEMVEIV